MCKLVLSPGWAWAGSVLAWPPPPWQARVILEKATKVSFKQVDDLAGVWCECGELELRHENYEQALQLLRVSARPAVVGAAGGQRAWDSPRAPSLPPSLGRRRQHCPPAGPSTLTPQSRCRTACTSP